MGRRIGWAVLLCGVAATCRGAVPPAPAASVAALAPVTVRGTLPGPGLWKVSRGDHVLWILGTLDWLPGDMTWRSRGTLATLRGSQALLLPPSARLKADVGVFGRLFLLPHLIGLRDNPHHARLAEVVPAPTYARWRTLAARYLAGNRKVEKWRPVFAAAALYRAAARRAGVSDRGVVAPVLRSAAKAAHIPVIDPAYVVEVEHPARALKAFKRAPLDDAGCLEKVMDRAERDASLLARRADAWATGDVDTLRRLLDVQAGAPCLDALESSPVLRDRGIRDLSARMDQAWLARARALLARNRSTLAMLPMKEVLAPDGLLAALRRAGYRVRAPDAEADDADTPATAASAPESVP